MTTEQRDAAAGRHQHRGRCAAPAAFVALSWHPCRVLTVALMPNCACSMPPSRPLSPPLKM